MASGISPILLVEDDDVLAGLLVEILGGLGEVVWSASAEEAEGRLGSRQWDLIVADVELPGRTGIEVVERVRALHPLCSTLIISGRSSFDYAVGAIRAGADDYLTKPLDPTAFFEKARELLERTRARRERGRVSVLAVGAHPDDPEIGVGGILLKHAAHGHRRAPMVRVVHPREWLAVARADRHEHKQVVPLDRDTDWRGAVENPRRCNQPMDLGADLCQSWPAHLRPRRLRACLLVRTPALRVEVRALQPGRELAHHLLHVPIGSPARR